MNKRTSHKDALVELMRDGRVWERFMRFVEPEPNSGCWLWAGTVARERRGFQYGRFNFNGKMVYAHRFAYEHERGPIPDGLDLLHRCDTPPCVNPAHTRPGTELDNTRDALERGRHTSQRITYLTHCKRGHEYTPENSIWKSGAAGYRGGMKRECRTCSAMRKRLAYARSKR